MNTVQNLKTTPFHTLSQEEKLEVKRLGPDQPDLKPHIQTKRKFLPVWYTKHLWLTGDLVSLKVYCFPCLLFNINGRERTWINGIDDWVHIGSKIKTHEKSQAHINSSLSLHCFGKTNIAESLSAAHRLQRSQQNLEVDRNRHVLGRIIDCIKFCGAFELALRGSDEHKDSENPGIFRGLINFTSELDSIFDQHLKTCTVFKGTSKTIQNELLNVMSDVIHDEIKQEIKNSDFLSVISDDTTDIGNFSQNVVVFRYLIKGKVVERFWNFSALSETNADSISDRIINCLQDVLPNEEDKIKLVGQCYDGANVMSGKKRSAHTIIKENYPNAHYIHCYAHQLNLILQQACSKRIPEMGIFFSNLSAFSAFFSVSPKRTEYLDRVVARRLPRGSQTRWNFSQRVVHTVKSHREDLIKCFEDIQSTWTGSSTTRSEACGLLRWLHDLDFMIYLSFLNNVLFHSEILYNSLQSVSADALYVNNVIDKFVSAIEKERSHIPALIENTQRDYPDLDSRRGPAQSAYTRILYEVCDVIINQCRDRFKYSGHLVAASLLDSGKFEIYALQFPKDKVTETCTYYPFLDQVKLESELRVLFNREDFHKCSGALSLLDFMVEGNLTNLFSEITKLISVIVTLPMTSSEGERCFSTLKRIKSFLRNTMSGDRLNALAMLSMEKSIVKTSSFNDKVIDNFAHQKNRRLNFLYR